MNLKNLIGHLYTLLSPTLRSAKVNKTALIIKPLKMDNAKAISIGARTYIGHYAWLMGGSADKKITIQIDENVQIGHFAHIVGMENVHIEKKVLIADKVFISDCTHNYNNIDIPIMDQGVKVLKPVTIGEGTWIGENVCVCGANVGKHCVIGANSVVLRDIPDYCVAAGNPARVIKKYDFTEQRWKIVTN